MVGDWIKEGDEVTVVTSEEAESLLGMISDDGDVLQTWVTAMSQLRPSEKVKYPVDIHPDDRPYAEQLVGIGLLVRSDEDVDAYLVPRSMAYADTATHAYARRLH